VVQLGVEHRGGDVGVLHREGSTEAAALIRVGQFDDVDAGGSEKGNRPVAEAQSAQRVAGRVVRHAAAKAGTDVLDAAAVDEELRQLPGALGQSISVAREAGQVRANVCHARPGRRDDGLVRAEHVHEAPGEPARLVDVAGVEVHLPATRLLGRKSDGDPLMLEQLDGRLPHLRRERVRQARDEERALHRH
jgi:hypothetical protein